MPSPLLRGGICLGVLACIYSLATRFYALVIIFVAASMATEFFRPKFPTPERGGIVVITGASSGIGRSAALSLAAQGFTVLAGVRRLEDARDLAAAWEARLTAAAAGHTGSVGALRPIILDVTDVTTIDAAVREVSELVQMGRNESLGLTLAGVVCNAGK